MNNIKQRALYKTFQEKFPLETLKDMPLEKYTNLNKDDSFCYWLESKTRDLGSIAGGSSYKFGIYKYQNHWNQTSVFNRTTNMPGMQNMAQVLHRKHTSMYSIR